jgi:hypothetical protein
MMIGAGALGALGVGIGTYALTADAEDFFARMLAAELPGVRIPKATLTAYTQAALQGRNPDFFQKIKILAGASRVVGYNGVKAALKNNWGFQLFMREMLTDFLMRSDFFQLADPTQEDVYFPPDASPTRYCGNPFAQFQAPA